MVFEWFHFSHWFTNLVSWGGQRPPQLRPGSACRSKKDGSRELKKHVKNVISKVPTSVTNMLQNEGLKKWSFRVFWGPHPRMVSKASPDRLQGTKACQNGGPELDFLIFCDNYFILFGCTFEMFEYIMKNVLIILFVKLLTLVVQPSKLSWVTYAKWAQLD